jgi:hypothetical protein
MPRSDEEIPHHDYNRVVELCDDCAEAAQMGRLTKWEEQFIEDIGARIAEYGRNTRLSEKQWEIIDRLEEKVYSV